jgi:short-subunit dehydrogenase
VVTVKSWADAMSLLRWPDGASAVILGRRGDVLNEAAAKLEQETGGKCLAVQGDVRKPESLAAGEPVAAASTRTDLG